MVQGSSAGKYRADQVAALAARISAFSKHLVIVTGRKARALARALGTALRRAADAIYHIYLLFERSFSSVLADLTLLSWSLRYLVAIVLVEGTVIWGAFRFPILWVVVVALVVALGVAMREVIHDYHIADIDAPRDYSENTREVIASIFRYLFRACAVVLTVAMGVASAEAYYRHFHFWPVLPMPGAIQTSVSEVATSTGDQAQPIEPSPSRPGQPRTQRSFAWWFREFWFPAWLIFPSLVLPIAKRCEDGPLFVYLALTVVTALVVVAGFIYLGYLVSRTVAAVLW